MIFFLLLQQQCSVLWIKPVMDKTRLFKNQTSSSLAFLSRLSKMDASAAASSMNITIYFLLVVTGGNDNGPPGLYS